MFAQLRHNKSLTLLLSLLLLILIFPFFETSRVGNLLFILLYSTVLISGIYAISYDARYLAVGILFAAPVRSVSGAKSFWTIRFWSAPS